MARNERDPATQRSRTGVLYNFGREDETGKDAVRRLVASLSRLLDPACARHGVLKGQIDISARLIWLAEKLGWAYDVRWPEEARLTSRQTP